jgi:hypothetical protein
MLALSLSKSKSIVQMRRNLRNCPNGDLVKVDLLCEEVKWTYEWVSVGFEYKVVYIFNVIFSSDEDDPYVEICARKKTRPIPPVYTHRKVNLEDDLALSSDSSDEELDEAAREIVKELF